MNCIFPTLKLA